jgi:hypothetical protein
VGGRAEEDDAPGRGVLAARPAGEPPATAALAAVLGLLPRWEQRHGEGRARRQIIDGSPALTARERGKQAGHERTLAEGLVRRGADPAGARLIARTAVACLHEAATRWLADDDPDDPGLRERVLGTVAELARELATAVPPPATRSGRRSRGRGPATDPAPPPNERT